jgi:alpha-N-arabinofuranosidase
VEIANFAQMVNAIAPIFTNKQGLFLQTVYHPLRLYAEHAQEVALDVFVDAPTYDLTPEQDAHEATPTDRPWKVADLGPFQLLDVTATCDRTGRELCLAVINRSPLQDLATCIQLDGYSLTGELVAYEVNGPNPRARNSFAQPNAVDVQTHRLRVGSGPVDYTFPAHSVTLLRGQLQ